MERTSKKNFIIDVLYAVLVFALIFAVSYAVIKFLLPFVAGAAIALAVQRPAQKLSQKVRLSKGASAAVISFLLYLIIGGILVFLVYRLVLSAVGFTDFLPRFFEKVGEVAGRISDKYSSVFERIPEEISAGAKTLFNETLQNFISSFGGFITDAVSSFIKRLPLLFVSGIVTLVATCYIAKDFDKLKKFVKAVIGNAAAKRTVRIKNILVGSVFKLLKGYFLLSAITCAQLFIGFLLLKIEHPFTLAVIIAAVDLLPVLGTGTVMIPWAFITLLSGNYTLGTGLGVLYIITVIVRNFLEPKIIGMQLGINSLFTLVAMFLGLKTIGFWGLILFPIIFIVTVQYYREDPKEGLSV